MAKPGGTDPFAKCARGRGTRPPRMPTETPDASKPPAHRDKTAMNGAQLLMAQRDSSGLTTGPPASFSDRDGALSGAQMRGTWATHLQWLCSLPPTPGPPATLIWDNINNQKGLWRAARRLSSLPVTYESLRHGRAHTQAVRPRSDPPRRTEPGITHTGFVVSSGPAPAALIWATFLVRTAALNPLGLESGNRHFVIFAGEEAARRWKSSTLRLELSE